MNLVVFYGLISVLMVLPFGLYAQKAEEAGLDYKNQQGIGIAVQRSEQADAAFVFYKDPFESYLPKGPEGASVSPKQGELGPPPVTIEGILWGSDKPMVIIDGEVYNVGDTLLTGDAKVFKIKDNIVFISYGERIYEMNVKTNMGANVETKGVQ